MDTAETFSTGFTPLMKAINKGNTEEALHLIESGADVDAKSRYTGMTPLHIAVLRKDEQVVRALIEKCADVNAACVLGETPLYIAFITEQEDIISLLKSIGAKMPDFGSRKIRQDVSMIHLLNHTG